MKITFLTLFPEMFQGPFQHSIMKRAQEKGLLDIDYCNIRDFGIGKHHLVDDTPYGGGIGMVMRVDVIHAALQAVQKNTVVQKDKQRTILISAQGHQFKQTKAQEYAELDHLIMICGHYEGIDDRIHAFIDEEISIGDFVVTGGELPAMLIADAAARLIPGVITAGATDHESFSYTVDGKQTLEYPQYTKPPVYEGLNVPEILLSGNHANIEKWKREEAVKKTIKVRPDMT